jgi:hypothetical protein
MKDSPDKDLHVRRSHTRRTGETEEGRRPPQRTREPAAGEERGRWAPQRSVWTGAAEEELRLPRRGAARAPAATAGGGPGRRRRRHRKGAGAVDAPLVEEEER